MNSRYIKLSTLTAILVAITIALCGCESDDNEQADAYLDGNDSEAGSGSYTEDFTIDPATKTLNSDGESATFAVAGGVSPYDWAVQDAALGQILSTGTDNAVYQRGAAGDNVLVATDKKGNKAYAVISQP